MFGLTVFLFVAFLMMFMGTVVLVHAPGKLQHRLFFGWTLFASGWMVANYLETLTVISQRFREVLLRMDFVFAMVAAGTLLLFVFAFTGRKLVRKHFVIALAPPLVFSLLSFTPWLPAKVFFSPEGEIKFIDGFIFAYLYGPALLAYFISSCVLLFRQGVKGPKRLRGQMLLVGWGLLVTTMITSVLNLFFQNALHPDVLRIGIYAFAIFILSVFVSVVRHEFLKVRFLLVEVVFLFVLAATLARTILSHELLDVALNAAYFVVILVSGFAMMRLVIRDYDRWKKMQMLADDLAVANEELRELDRLKSEFISIASHQLRTPVSVMKGYLSLIAEEAYGKVGDTVKEKLRQMYRMNDRLVHLISNMLNVSRIEKERIDYSCSDFNVTEVVREIVNEMKYKAEEKGLSLRFLEEDEGIPVRVHADKEKVSEVLTNLIDNAIKYTEKGSAVLTLATDGKAEEVTVRVKDTGLGIPEEALRHVFAKFYRAKRDINLRTQGTGLGLYICKVFVEGMGGKIEVEETSEEGTTIAFTLPMVPKGECLGEAPKGALDGGETAV